ncbi:MAG: ABC transporter substrate-binding protein, partial [Dehalococcoidales bacterium]|nr:ABC transporter substrate-binding protein [Dehalococcoidales bacterium]
ETLLMGDIDRGPRGTNEWSFPQRELTPEQYITGRLIENWEVSPTKLVYHVRPGMYLTGKSVNPGVGERREFTAEDVKYTADIALPSQTFGWLWDWIRNVEVVDKYTVVFNLSRFKNTWSLHAGYGFGGLEHPVAREIVEAGVTDWRNHYGTGPFILANYVEGSAITYERNPEYWGRETLNGVEYQLPYVDKVVVPVLKDWSTKIAALRTGKLDLCNNVALTYRDTLASTSPDLLYRDYFPGSVQFIGMQFQGGMTAVEPFTDRRVRKALSAAIDRQAIIDQVFLDGHILAWPVGPHAEGVFSDWDKLPGDLPEFFDYDPEYAKKLLADAGYPNGFSTEWITRAPTAQDEDMFTMVLAYWDAIGVDCELKVVETGAGNALAVTKDYPQMFSYSAGVGAPMYMENWANPTANNNVANYVNMELTEKFRKAQAMTKAEQTPLMREVSLMFLQDMPYIVMPVPKVRIYWWPWLKNYFGEVDAGYFSDAIVGSRVWLDPNLKKKMGF